MEGRALAQRAGDGIIVIDEHLKRAFHPPLGHRFAGVLAGIEPDLLRAFADHEQIEILAVERLAEQLVTDAGHGGDPADQIMVPFHRIRCEIGEPQAVALGGQLDRQHAIGEAGGNPVPGFAIVGYADAIILPAAGIGRATSVEDAQGYRRALCPGEAEVEPLIKIGRVILDDFQIEGAAILLEDADVAAVEAA